MNEHLFEAATEFLHNSGTLPNEIINDPKFVFLAAMLQDLQSQMTLLDTMAKDSKHRIDRIVTSAKVFVAAVGAIGTILGILRIGGIL